MQAESNLLKRANLRLKGDNAIEMKKMEKLVRENNLLRDAMEDREVREA